MINLKSLKNSIPLAVRLFLGKALLLFIAWKIIYGVFLYDSKILDYPLTIHVAEASTQLLNSLGGMSDFVSEREIYESVNLGEKTKNEASAIYHNDYRVLFIADSCNGLELIALYIGFIICMPCKFWRKIKYIILGIIILDVTNILRCVGLIYLREYFEVYFDFAHHYLFKATVYTATFLMWMVYARKIQLNR